MQEWGPTLLGLPLPLARGWPVSSRMSMRWKGHSEVVTVSVSSRWRQTLGRAPQIPRTTGEGWNKVSLPPDSTAARRKQLFTWVRCSAGRVASSRASLPPPGSKAPQEVGAGVGEWGGAGSQLTERCQELFVREREPALLCTQCRP